MLKSQTAITKGDGKFFIGETQISAPAEDEVLVQIKAAGICHTDFDSLNWGRLMVIGHEGAGIVIQKGEMVNKIPVGQHVVLNWAIPCHTCFQCKTGNQHLCEKNSPVTAGKNGYCEGHATPDSTQYQGNPITRSFNLGTLSEYAVVKAAAATPIPAEVPFQAAAIAGCGVMTGFGSVVNAAKLTPGSSVVVIGSGGVGLNVIQTARLMGAGKIIVIDRNKKRLQFAKLFGATHIFLADDHDHLLQNMALKVKASTENRGADYAFECTAVPELGATPLAMIRNGGTAIQVSGIEQEISVDMNLFEWDKKYINPLYGQCNPDRDFEKIFTHYLNKELLLDELVTQTYTLSGLPRAFEDMLSGKNAKGVILF